ncbi:MAG: deoxyuridine 5'-triphosphate nucleotidohydrolase [Spirochaetes bacterium GWF1_51_8]|nr:MAG: deoxyuridine 5'-triphosphate nucleotidohydrolase [Spirochaetes bacterium GWF1_51_8]
MKVLYKRLHPGAAIPCYQTEHSAGADIHACLDTPMTLASGEIALVPTGFAMAIPNGFEAQIRPRSGLGAKGISVPNAPGTIDADYRGEVKVILINLGQTPFTVSHHDRIAQMVFAPVIQAVFNEAPELPESVRGTGGFGSTGVGKN